LATPFTVSLSVSTLEQRTMDTFWMQQALQDALI
jgi:hypothetical protein